MIKLLEFPFIAIRRFCQRHVARLWLLLPLMLTACAHTLTHPVRPCAQFAADMRYCLSALPKQAPFIERTEQTSATFLKGEQVGLTQLAWQAGKLHIASSTLTGQRLYELQYDGRSIDWQQGVLPFSIPPEYILFDIEMIWWPLADLQVDISTPWVLSETVQNDFRERILRYHDQPVVRVRYITPINDTGSGPSVQYEQLKLGYQLSLTGLSQEQE